MNAIATVTSEVEIILPGQGVTLILALHPLKLDTEVLPAPAGLTVADLVELGRARATTRLRSRINVYLDGHLIPEEYWRLVRPKPGTSMLLRAVAEGGDSNSLLRAGLGIAVAAAAIFLAPIIAPLLLPGLAFGTALVGAAITVGGQLLINALFPVASPQLASDSKSQAYSISGGQNVADPYGVIPVILGTNRVYPKLGAKSYTEFIGSDQYLRMLFIWGYGPLDIGDLKIGETLLSDYDDVEIETREGYDTDTPLTLFPGQVLQDDLSIDLTAAAGWQTRTTDTAIDEISLDIVAPGGVVRIDSTGTSQNYTVSIRVEYSPTGAGTWSLLGTLDLTSKSTDAIRTGLRLAVTNGQYDVRVKKTSTDYSGSDQVQEQVVWTALRGFRNTPPVAFAKPLAMTAIRIRATSQLNGVIDQLNAVCSSRVLAFNGTSWVADTVSRNPADLFRHVLQGPANAKPQADGKIDLATIETWWEFCDLNSFNFDMIRDFTGSVYDCLTDVAASGRGAQIFRDGKWSTAWEEADDPIVQHFTPRNSWGFSGQRAYVQTPHAFRVRFVNATNGYQQDERIVYDDGYNADGSDGLIAATLFEQIEFPGETDPDTVWRFGRYHIAQARLRPEIYGLSTDFEHIVATRGDRVRVTHDVPLWGLATGRVKAVAGSSITLDEPLTMVGGHTYTIRFRLADGSSMLKTISTVAGAQTVVTATGGDVGSPAVGDLFMAGETGEESVVLRVRSITPGDDVSAKLSLVDDAPEILDADTGTIPAFDSHITVPPATFTQAPINLAVRETFSGTGHNNITGAFFSWDVEAGQFPVGFDAQYRDEDGDGLWKPTPTPDVERQQVFVTDYHAGTWGWRVRSRFSDGTVSGWATLASEAMVGGTTTATIADGSINLEALGNQINALLDYYSAALADINENMGKIGGILDAQDLSNYQDKIDIIAAATGQVAAEARIRIAAIAAIGSAVASGLIQFDSSVAGSGASAVATISIKVRANVGDTAADSGIVIQASADGAGGTTSQILMKANQLFITDGVHTSDAFTFDATSGALVLKTLRFQQLLDISGTHISINGNTGAVTFSS